MIFIGTVQASLLSLRLFRHGDPLVTAYYLYRNPSELGDTEALAMNFDIAVQILDQQDLGFPLDWTYINMEAQVETIPEEGVLQVKTLQNGLVPCAT